MNFEMSVAHCSFSVCLQKLFQEVGQASSAKLQHILAGLPWLLVRFKAALKRSAKALANSGRDSLDVGRGHPRGGTQAGSATASADFGFYALLLEPVLAGLESAPKVNAMQITLLRFM